MGQMPIYTMDFEARPTSFHHQDCLWRRVLNLTQPLINNIRYKYPEACSSLVRQKMPAYWKYHLLSMSILSLVWQSNCMDILLPGDIIWRSERPIMQASNIAVNHEEYIPLKINEVEDRAENMPEEALINYLKSTPQFSKQTSTIFKDLDQRNSDVKYDYIFIKDSLKILEKEALGMHSMFEQRSDFKKLSMNIQHLKDFNELLQQGTKERIDKLKDQGSHVKTYMEIIASKQKRLARRVKAFFQHSKNNFSPSVLNLAVKMVWDGQIERLNDVLHELNSLKDAKKEMIFSAVNILIDKLERNIFQAVHYMYKQEMISTEAVKEFFQSKNTLELAVLNMYSNPEMDKSSDLWYQHFIDKNPISTLNEWYCANCRTLSEVLDEREKRYFSYLSLRTFKLYFENFQSPLNDLLFEDDHLFHTLEESFSKFSKNSLSKAEDALNHGEIHQYSQIKNKVQALIDTFHNSEDEQSITSAFFVLDFIQSNYGLDILEVQKGELFQEKMNSISSGFQMLAEVQKIMVYISNKTSSRLTQTDDMKAMGGEVVMISKYHDLLLPKIKHILFQNELVPSFQKDKIYRDDRDLLGKIHQIMSVNKYYSIRSTPHSAIN